MQWESFDSDSRHVSHNYLPPKVRQSSILTEQILEEISKSITNFKPSKSLADLMESSPASRNSDEPAAEIDVVISGGGLKHFFMVGAAYVLKKALEKNNVRIARIRYDRYQMPYDIIYI